jgi:hypothetical protein
MPKTLQPQEVERILDGVLVGFDEIEETANNLVLGTIEQDEYKLLRSKQGTLYLRGDRKVELLSEDRVCSLKQFLVAFISIVRRKAEEQGIIGLLPINGGSGEDAAIFANLIRVGASAYNDGHVLTLQSSLYFHGRPVTIKSHGKADAGALRFADGSALRFDLGKYEEDKDDMEIAPLGDKAIAGPATRILPPILRLRVGDEEFNVVSAADMHCFLEGIDKRQIEQGLEEDFAMRIVAALELLRNSDYPLEWRRKLYAYLYPFDDSKKNQKGTK